MDTPKKLSSQAFTVRIPNEIHAVLKEVSFYADLPMNTLIVHALARHLPSLTRFGYLLSRDRYHGHGGTHIPVMTGERANQLREIAQEIRDRTSSDDAKFWVDALNDEPPGEK